MPRKITYSKFSQNLQVFSGDLALVQQAGDDPIMPSWTPKSVGYYSLTQPDGSGTELDSLRDKPVLLLFGCMDKRFAYPLYQLAKKRNNRFHIASIFVAAGIAQFGDKGRVSAMRKLTSYLLQELDVRKIWATDHLHDCGGLNYIHGHDGSVCNGLGCEPGDKIELEYVKKQVRASTNRIIPARWLIKTQTKILTIGRKGEVKFA